MKVLVILEFEIPNPECVAEVLSAINPPALPHFQGDARITIEPVSSAIINFLDESGEIHMMMGSVDITPPEPPTTPSPN